MKLNGCLDLRKVSSKNVIFKNIMRIFWSLPKSFCHIHSETLTILFGLQRPLNLCKAVPTSDAFSNFSVLKPLPK